MTVRESDTEENLLVARAHVFELKRKLKLAEEKLARIHLAWSAWTDAWLDTAIDGASSDPTFVALRKEIEET